MTEEQPWKPQGETIKERAIETSRKLLDIGLTQAGVIERVVFQEIQRVLAPRLEQRIQNESEESVQTQLVRLRTWIDAVLGEEEAYSKSSSEPAKKTQKSVKAVKNVKSAQKRANAKRRSNSAAAKMLTPVKPVAVLTSFDTNNHTGKSSIEPTTLC